MRWTGKKKQRRRNNVSTRTMAVCRALYITPVKGINDATASVDMSAD
jgi:hypothetical protein